MIDITAWMQNFLKKLNITFENRVWFVGLQGSYGRGEATENSDIDFYVEFSKPLGLRYCSFFSDIEESVGKSVDIITKDGLYNPVTLSMNEPLIKRILEERKCIYE